MTGMTMDSDAIKALVEQAVNAAVTTAVQQVITAVGTGSLGASATTVTTTTAAHAVVPGGAGSTPWNIEKGDGFKLCVSSTSALDPTAKHSGGQEGLCHFLDDVHDRADSFGWLAILHIADDKAEKRWLTSEFGALALGNVKASATVHMQVEGREQQASNCLKKLIKNSISHGLWDKLHLRRDEHIVEHPASTTAPAIVKEDGALMLHALTCIVACETRTTISSLLKQLNSMESIMEDVQSNVQEFNKKVNVIPVGLRARRATVPDVLPNLFEACKNCADTHFVNCITRKEEEHEDGTLVDFTKDKLMKMAHERFKSRNEKNVWMQKSEQELEFLALKAELDATKKRLTQKKATGARAKAPYERKPWANDGAFAWKAVGPKTGEPHKKQANGKTRVCCPHHGDTKWVLKEKNGVVHLKRCNALRRSKLEAGNKDDKPVALASAIAQDAPSKDSGSATPPPNQRMMAKCLATPIGMADEDSDEEG